MRWFVGGAVALVLVWAAYVVSPYWALGDLAAGLEAGDAERVASRVNIRAVRLSLAKQLVAEGLAQKAAPPGAASSDAQLAAGAIALAAEPFFARMVTPEGLLALLTDVRKQASPEAIDDARRLSGRSVLSRIPALIGASRWRGFRNVYVSVPPAAAIDEQGRLQLRLSRLSWRLVAVELRPVMRARLLEEVLRQRR